MNAAKVRPTEWLQSLQKQGYHLTPTKEALLNALSGASFPISVEAAWDLVRQQRPSTGRATVYRLFDMLETHGFLRRVHGVNHCNQYVLAQDSARPLFVCLTCGKAEFLPVDELSAHLEALSHKSGYALHATHIQLLGTCNLCSALV